MKNTKRTVSIKRVVRNLNLNSKESIMEKHYATSMVVAGLIGLMIACAVVNPAVGNAASAGNNVFQNYVNQQQGRQGDGEAGQPEQAGHVTFGDNEAGQQREQAGNVSFGNDQNSVDPNAPAESSNDPKFVESTDQFNQLVAELNKEKQDLIDEYYLGLDGCEGGMASPAYRHCVATATRRLLEKFDAFLKKSERAGATIRALQQAASNMATNLRQSSGDNASALSKAKSDWESWDGKMQELQAKLDGSEGEATRDDVRLFQVLLAEGEEIQAKLQGEEATAEELNQQIYAWGALSVFYAEQEKDRKNDLAVNEPRRRLLEYQLKKLEEERIWAPVKLPEVSLRMQPVTPGTIIRKNPFGTKKGGSTPPLVLPNVGGGMTAQELAQAVGNIRKQFDRPAQAVK